jgi:hypothetical protein
LLGEKSEKPHAPAAKFPEKTPTLIELRATRVPEPTRKILRKEKKSPLKNQINTHT